MPDESETEGWSKSELAGVIDGLLRLCRLTLDSAEEEIQTGTWAVHRNTAQKVFKKRDKMPDNKTLDKVAEYFNTKLPGLGLKGEHLRRPPEVLRAVLAQPTAPTVYGSQEEALDALKKRAKDGLVLKGHTVYVVSFTLHTLLPSVRWFCDQGAASVRLFAGLEETALQLNSRRQAGLMVEQRNHVKQDFAHDPVDEVRSPMPPTFQGYFVPDVVVCVSPFVWYPTFNAWKGSPKLEDMHTQMRETGVTPPMLPEDDYTLNGYQQCHFQVFHASGGDNTQFDRMAKKFKLYLDAHELRQRLDADSPAQPPA